MVGMIDQKIRAPTVSCVPMFLTAMTGRNPDSIGWQERMSIGIPHNVRYQRLVVAFGHVGMTKGAH